jgi:hypothetical protein
MTVYNLYGKRCPCPPLTDFAQGLGWASLAVYAALVLDPGRRSHDWLVVGAVALFGVGFILLISGIHGGLRDLVNDRAHGRPTTARFLGSGTDETTGEVTTSRGTRSYAFAVHSAMFVLPALIVLDAAPRRFAQGLALAFEERAYLGAVLVIVLLSSHWVLARVVHEREPQRERWISTWGPVVMQAPLLGFAPALAASPLIALVIAFYAPLLSTRQFLIRLVRYARPSLAGRIEDPPGRGPRPQLV